MADVVPYLMQGLALLEGVRTADASPLLRDQANALINRLNNEIVRLQVTDADLKDRVVEKIDHHASRMREALDAADFDGVINHAFEMIGALPGDQQTGQKPPWER